MLIVLLPFLFKNYGLLFNSTFFFPFLFVGAIKGWETGGECTIIHGEGGFPKAY